MKIQAINPLMSATNCQPLRPASFDRRNDSETYLKEQTFGDVNSFTSSSPCDLDKKYDLACRFAALECQVAAYYKTQYEKLLQNGDCIA